MIAAVQDDASLVRWHDSAGSASPPRTQRRRARIAATGQIGHVVAPAQAVDDGDGGLLLRPHLDPLRLILPQIAPVLPGSGFEDLAFRLPVRQGVQDAATRSLMASQSISPAIRAFEISLPSAL